MNRVPKMEVGEKVIVCGRSARWRYSEIRERTALRQQFGDLWDEYCHCHLSFSLLPL